MQKIEGLYVNSYGNHSDPALIFIHGGPGYDSQDFEWTTATTLAQKGFFVVVYDQRGQGRSDILQDPSKYSYKQYADDIKLIITQLNLNKPVLIGHSHGGPIAMKFDQRFPGLASKIILVSAPVNFWKGMESIKLNCTSRFTAINDTFNLNKLNNDFSILSGYPNLMDEITAVGDMFQLGISKSCHLYTPSQPTTDAMALHNQLAKNYVRVAQENMIYPMGNFIVYEQYIHMDQTAWLQANADHVFGIYGDEDGLFTPNILEEIQKSLSLNTSPFNFQLINGASHAVYIDQQNKFIQAIANILK
jgi:proline iminopeptidase